MREIVLREARDLTPTVRALSFECTDGEPLRFIPGQWLNLHVEQGAGVGSSSGVGSAVAVSAVAVIEKRAYSIASAPDFVKPDRFELAVTRVNDGAVSLALHALAVGSRLQMDGPHGFFTREGTETEAALFVGTGTGVCPLRSMLETELRNAEGPKLALLLGCRSEADILYRTELEALAARSARFDFAVTLSQPSASWRGLRGYVQTHLAARIERSAPPHVYICGLTRMVSEVRRVLKDELGYDRKRIHSERYD